MGVGNYSFLHIQSLPEQDWQIQDRFLELRSHWMTLIGEHLQTHQGQALEYWRIEKADSVIILPIIAGNHLLTMSCCFAGVVVETALIRTHFERNRVSSRTYAAWHRKLHLETRFRRSPD